jgi:glutamate racemase
VFDSGLGGLSILREIRRQLPAEDVLYVADQAHVPYGPRPLGEVRRFSEGITRFLLEQQARLIVVACNTASAAALKHLRATFPGVPFVGMEPAVKPAAQSTQTRAVGVLATPATFQGELFASVVERFAAGVRVFEQTIPGLVERIEAGELDRPATRELLQRAVGPLLERGIDTLVLACTHYPFVIPLLTEIAGPGVQIIDPSPAIARQAARLSAASASGADRSGDVAFFTTGDPELFSRMSEALIGLKGEVRQARWDAPGLLVAL